MKEKDKIRFYDTSNLIQTPNIRKRCDAAYIEGELKRILPEETFRVTSVKVNETGFYKGKTDIIMKLLGASTSIKGLPPYCEVQIDHQTGKVIEHMIVWSPLAWNDRFAGTAGGGTSTGGVSHIIDPNNFAKGWILPFALVNGFTSATTDSGNNTGGLNWAFDARTGELNMDRIENWRARGTHFMTLFGKAVAEILHHRPVRFAYMNGGSGGGRQAMMEAQEYPEDYDGIWASCPAINWTKFMLLSHWSIAVMNSYGHILKPNKMKYFLTAVHESVGGKDAYYRLDYKVDFDPASVIGHNTKDGPITELDAAIMKEIWNGPHRRNGEWLWYGFRPGIKYWGLPLGHFFHSPLSKKPKAFISYNINARWVTENRKQKFDKIMIEDFEQLYDLSISKFANVTGDKADLRKFAQAGGKLIIDHGLDDPIIPVDGTIDYYDRMCQIHGGVENVDKFCRFYLLPGCGHNSCAGNGPGITLSDGLQALIDWVENGQAPGGIRAVQVSRTGDSTICERIQLPYSKK